MNAVNPLTGLVNHRGEPIHPHAEPPIRPQHRDADDDGRAAMDIGEMTPTEIAQCEAAVMALNHRWMRKTYDPADPSATWDSFATEARNRFAEIGFTIDISWSEYTADGMPGTAAVPDITLQGRTEAHSTDHELIRREIAAGMDGTGKGYIREDGSRHEEPRKKTIT